MYNVISSYSFILFAILYFILVDFIFVDVDKYPLEGPTRTSVSGGGSSFKMYAGPLDN